LKKKIVLSKALHYETQIVGLVRVNGKVCPKMKIMSSIHPCDVPSNTMGEVQENLKGAFFPHNESDKG